MTEPAPEPASFDGPVVSVIAGDRLCTRCGFNLTGQEVVRESRYGLFVVRCPECGGVASLQEYPALNRWAGRWATLLAATWLIALGGLLFLTILACTAPIFGARELGTERYGGEIAQVYAESQGGQTNTTTTIGGRTIVIGSFNTVDVEWWRTSDARATLRAGRTVVELIVPEVWIVWLPMIPVLFLVGTVWSVILLHARAPMRVLFLALPFGIGSAIYLTRHFVESLPATGSIWARQIAQDELGLVLYAGTLVVLLVPAVAGVLVGRKLTRGLLRAMLPPRLLAPFATLWLADGKRPPVPTASRRP